MGKLKISFTTLMTLVLVGLLSIVAAAATMVPGPTNVTKTVTVNGGTHDVTINWDAVPSADTYNVYWNGDTTGVDNGAAKTYSQTGLADGNYTIAIEGVIAGVKTAKTSVTIQVKTATVDGGPITTGHPAKGINVATKDNNGVDSQQRTHGNFQNNTNSCANCHSTHNGEAAADGSNNFLLMKGGEFDLCMSCHDGTMGFYNVEGAYDGATASSISAAGTFDFDNSHLSASMHNVNSAVKVNSAPGAFKNASTATFECSSCHNPHGSVNDRLLNEKVAGSQYAYTYTSAPTGYQGSLVYTPAALVPLKTKAVNLDLVNDTAYPDINNFGTGGLRITISKGPVGDTDRLNMSNFCANCHDDYLKESSEKRADGHFTHTTTEQKGGRNCESCHYAHGTNINTLKDTGGNTIKDLMTKKGWDQAKATDYMKDISAKGSSLKKFTNMAVCWSCHQSSHAIDTNTPADFDGAGKPAN
jgi:predicted CXXCH cytochrome family protein